jgi:hypothetical protein
MLYQWSQQENPAKGSMVWSTCCPERMAQTINLGFPPGVKGYGNIKVVGVCTRKRPGELLAVALPPMHITRRRRRDTTTVLEIRFNIGYITPVRAAFCPLPARRPSHHLHSRCVTPTPPTGGRASLCQSHRKLGARPAFPGYGAPGMPMERELRDHAKEKIQRMINTRGYPLSYNLKAAGLRTAAAEKLAEEPARLKALVSTAASSLARVKEDNEGLHTAWGYNHLSEDANQLVALGYINGVGGDWDLGGRE